MDSLSGKVAIITGAGGGIGRAISLKLASGGARIVAADLDLGRAEATVAALREAGGDAIAVRVDVAVEAEIKAMVAAAVARFGGVDILVNNAAEMSPDIYIRDLGVTTMDEEVWDRTMTVNLRGPMFGCKHAVPEMIRRGGGAIVNTASVTALQGYPFMTAYGVSKAALITLTHYVATAHGKEGIRCNAVAPGTIPHPRLVAQIGTAPIDGVLPHNLLPYHGAPADIANAVGYLASDEARFVTGQVLVVDGGYTGHFPGFSELRLGGNS